MPTTPNMSQTEKHTMKANVLIPRTRTDLSSTFGAMVGAPPVSISRAGWFDPPAARVFGNLGTAIVGRLDLNQGAM
jgi:hypothetical protein